MAEFVDTKGVKESRVTELAELRPVTASLLSYLQARAGETVSKQELMDALWPDTHVTENSLYQTVSELRRALKDHPELELRTVPRRGYRLVRRTAPVAPRAEGRRPSWHVSRRVAAVAAGALVLIAALGVWGWVQLAGTSGARTAERPSIRIAPFRNDSDEARWDRLGRALAGEIGIALSEADWLRVIEGEGALPRYRVTGSIQSEGDRIAVQAQLVETDSGEIVWGRTWRDTRGRFFAIQDEITQQVAGALRGEWSGAIARNDRRLAHRRGTDNLDAYEHFLIGAEHKHRFTPEDYAIAARHLREAVALDPGYAQAWSTLGVVLSLQSSNASSLAEAQPLMEERKVVLRRALDLDPEAPSSLIGLNWLRAQEMDFAGAEAAIRKAVAMAPEDADILAHAAWVGSWRNDLGADAVDWAARARVLNPNWPAWYAVASGIAAFNAGDYAGSVQALAEAPDFVERHLYTAAALGLKGDLGAAFSSRTALLEVAPEFDLATYLRVRGVLNPDTRGPLVAGARLAGIALKPSDGSVSDALPSVVVLPFSAPEDAPDWQLFGTSLAGEVAGALAGNKWVRVHAPDRAAEARFELKGSLLSRDGRLFVNASLTERTSGELVWSDRWEGAETEFFDLQAKVAHEAASELGGHWSGAVVRFDARKAARRPTGNLDAYALFLRGTQAKHRFTPEGFEEARQLLTRAVEIDPAFVDAWTTLSVVHNLRALTQTKRAPLEAILAERAQAVETAVRLAPEDPTVLMEQGWLLARRGDHAAAAQAVRRAAEIAPDNPDVLAYAALNGNLRVDLGKDGVAWVARARVLNPDPPPWYSIAEGLARFTARDWQGSIDAFANAPDYVTRHLFTAAALLQMGREADARDVAARLQAQYPGFRTDFYVIQEGMDMAVNGQLLIDVAADLGLLPRKALSPPPANAAASSD